ncbi:hypothetical protein EON65_32330 [archaeon]|nr:MAG: hypothetical protein EON65_32330 [archaeon]
MMQKEVLYQAVFRTSKLFEHVAETQRRAAYSKLYWPLFSYLNQHYSAFNSKHQAVKKTFLVGLSAPQVELL